MTTTNFSSGTVIASAWLNDVDSVTYERTVNTKSLEEYGAVGNGTTDDTTAIQAAFTAGGSIAGTPGKTYLISSTITVDVASTMFDGKGCSFKVASGTLTGNMLQGMFFRVNTDKVVLRNFSIPYNASASFSSSVDGQGMPVNRGAIVLVAANDCLIERIFITNSRAGATSTWNGGILMIGGHATNNTIQDCVIVQTAHGIIYNPDSYNGSGNKVLRNKLTDCFYAINGSDPTASYTAYGNIVADNYLSWTTFSVYMGIEDYSASSGGLRGTRIVRNTIVGSSTSVPLYYAISAVSHDAIVDGNVIIDWYVNASAGKAAIETVGDGNITVANNVVRWSTTPEGVGASGREGVVQSGNLSAGANKFIGNKFENANFGIWIHPVANKTTDIIIGNSFIGCAVPFYHDGSTGNVSFISNSIRVTRPQTASRGLCQFIGPRAEIIGNSVIFEAASAQPTYLTSVFLVSGDNVSIIGNYGDCGGYVFTAEVLGVYTNGATPTNAIISNNTFVGGMNLYYDYFTKVQASNNVVTTGPHAPSNIKLSFYDGQTPVVQPTGYGTPTNVSKTSSLPGTTATLAQVGGTLAALIADLKSQNLIGA